MTQEEHKRRHQQLHKALDELASDWLLHQPLGGAVEGIKLFDNTSILELMQWSYRQTIEPEPIKERE